MPLARMLNEGMNSRITLTKKDIDLLEERFRDVFATKEELVSYKSDTMDKLDEILREIVTSHEEQILLFAVV